MTGGGREESLERSGPSHGRLLQPAQPRPHPARNSFPFVHHEQTTISYRGRKTARSLHRCRPPYIPPTSRKSTLHKTSPYSLTDSSRSSVSAQVSSQHAGYSFWVPELHKARLCHTLSSVSSPRARRRTAIASSYQQASRRCSITRSFADTYIAAGFQSKNLIVDAGLVLGDIEQFPNIDVTIDGADEVDDHLNCIKGGGGCQYREKVLAEAATT